MRYVLFLVDWYFYVVVGWMSCLCDDEDYDIDNAGDVMTTTGRPYHSFLHIYRYGNENNCVTLSLYWYL